MLSINASRGSSRCSKKGKTVVLDVLRTKVNRLDFGLFPERQRQRWGMGRDKDLGQQEDRLGRCFFLGHSKAHEKRARICF